MNTITFSLTEALMLAGGAVLLALLIHGWWIARRARPRDALSLESQRNEPGLAGGGGKDGDALASAQCDAGADLDRVLAALQEVVASALAAPESSR